MGALFSTAAPAAPVAPAVPAALVGQPRRREPDAAVVVPAAKRARAASTVPVSASAPVSVSASVDAGVSVKARRKKRKVAVFLGYIGARYSGMQLNPGVLTIEEVLLAAFYRAGAVSDSNQGSLSKVHWMRAARTDKGVSAAGQCVSAKLECEVGGRIDPLLVDAINRELPPDIQVYGMLRTTAAFNARTDCHRRRYEYMFPVRLLGGINGPEKGAEGGGDPRVARLTAILRMYEGTHCFANFTDGLNASDDASKRFMISVTCGEPFLPPGSGIYYVTVTIFGQSFVLHQIRKMVGLALFVFLDHAPLEAIPVALCPNVKLPTPMAPSLGLLLDELLFDNYNVRQKSGLPVPVGCEPFKDVKLRFKMNRIYSKIAETERRERVMETWVRKCGQSLKYDAAEIMNLNAKFVLSDVGREEQRRAQVASLYRIVTKMSDFIPAPNGEQHIGGPSDTTKLATEVQRAFKERYGTPASFLARAPGRINLIGEHLDYNELPVIGIAIQFGTIIAGCLESSDGQIEISHLEADKYGSGRIRANGTCLEEAPVSAEGISVAPADANLDTEWLQYVAWGVKALVDSLKLNRRTTPSGGRFLVAGNLPRAVGLGSSSSLVTCSALACARMNRRRMPRQELALTAAEGERVGAGTRGGSVDHILSTCGARGAAIQIDFSPRIQTTQLKLPEEVALIAVNSGVVAQKGLDADIRAQFNLRAAECRVAAGLLARRIGTHLPNSVTTPGWLLHQARKTGKLKVKTLADLQPLVARAMPPSEVIGLKQAIAELELNEVEIRNRFLVGAPPAKEFAVGKRIAHVFAEASRVSQFRELLTDDDVSTAERIARMGKIFNESHCSLRDLYECSCPAVDALVLFSRECGAIGSRITGAGWGGYVISLVPLCGVGAFMTKMGHVYGTDAVQVVESTAGACVYAMQAQYNNRC